MYILLSLSLYIFIAFSIYIYVVYTECDSTDRGVVHVCLQLAFQNLGIPIQIDRDGPLSVLKDGSPMLHPLGLCIVPVPRLLIFEAGRYVVYYPCHPYGHFVALLSRGNAAVKFDNGVRTDLDQDDMKALACDANHKVFRVKDIRDNLCARGGWQVPWYKTFDVQGAAISVHPRRVNSACMSGQRSSTNQNFHSNIRKLLMFDME